MLTLVKISLVLAHCVLDTVLLRPDICVVVALVIRQLQLLKFDSISTNRIEETPIMRNNNQGMPICEEILL